MKSILIIILISFDGFVNGQVIKSDTLSKRQTTGPFPPSGYDNWPTFPGGDDLLYKFINDNLQYPTNVACITGTVYLTFIVNADGKLSDVKIIRGLNKDIDDEAIRLIKIMPNWLPIKRKGEAVPVQFNLPIRFKGN